MVTKDFGKNSPKPSREPKKRGKPTRYQASFVAQILELARLGAAEVEMARVLGCALATLGLWKGKHPEFATAMRQGKDEFDVGTVEKALKDRALGYEYDETHYELRQEKPELTPDGPITPPPLLFETRRVRKHEPANVVAAIFWLCNRNPARWQQRREAINSQELPIIEIHMHHGKQEDQRDIAATQESESLPAAPLDHLPTFDGVPS